MFITWIKKFDLMVLWLYSKYNDVWKKLEVEFIRLMFVTR